MLLIDNAAVAAVLEMPAVLDVIERAYYEQAAGGAVCRTQEKHCVTPDSFCVLVFLLLTRTGESLALLNDGVLQHMRVGADSAIGTKRAARQDGPVLVRVQIGGG